MRRVTTTLFVLLAIASDISLGQEQESENKDATSEPGRSEFTESFDVPPDFYSTFLSGALTFDAVISCFFAVDTVSTESGSTPSIGLSFSSDDSEDDGEFVPIVRLWAFPEKLEQGQVWRYRLTIHHGEDSPGEYRQSEIRIQRTESESVLPMMLFWNNQDYALFLVGDDIDYLSTLDVSHLDLVSWEVYASGAKGKARCSVAPVG